jgi:hypothetical protein
MVNAVEKAAATHIAIFDMEAMKGSLVRGYDLFDRWGAKKASVIPAFLQQTLA